MGEVKLGHWLGKPSHGVLARLTSWDEKTDRHGARFWVCDFEAVDEGKSQSRIWPDDTSTVSPKELQIAGWYLVVWTSGQWGAQALHRLTAILPVSEALGWLESPAHADVLRGENWSRACHWFGNIPYPEIQGFVLQVFMNDSLRRAFFSAPASRQNHHSRWGGLAEHSLDSAVHLAEHDLTPDPLERWLASVAGLFHDVGKVRTHNPEKSVRRNAEIIWHDHLTLEILARPLAWLDRVAPDWAQALRYLLVYRYERDGRPLIPVALAVQAADRISAANSAREMAFASAHRNQRFATLKGWGPVCRYWRLGAEEFRPVIGP